MDGTEKGKTLTEFLDNLEKDKKVKFFYIREWFDGLIFNEPVGQITVREGISSLLNGTNLYFYELHRSAVIFIKDPSQIMQYRAKVTDAHRQNKKVLSYSFGEPSTLKEKITLSGVILDKETNSPLAGASIVCSDLNKVTIANEVGKFSMEVPPGLHLLSISFVNYDEKVLDVKAYDDGNFKIIMEETPTMLNEITVIDKSGRENTQSHIGHIQLNVTDIKKMPAFMGEVDVFKQIQKLPGVSTAGEAASGFNVRGGSADQNLILYDRIPVFNSSHLLGFLSSFNAEAIQSLSFYRGGIPSEFGGRVSSVLDIRSKEGDYDRWKGSGGIGIISSNLMVHGPLKKNKTVIAISARTTYSDWMINTLKSNYTNLKKSSVFFYDGSVRLTHKLNTKTKISGTTYSSRDKFHLKGDSSYFWNNFLSSVQVDHEVNPNFFTNFLLGFGSYQYLLQNDNPANGFDLGYKIFYPTLKADFHQHNDRSQTDFGFHSSLNIFSPGNFLPVNPSSNNTVLDKQRSIENALYVSHSRTFNKHFIEIGLRLSLFSSFGPNTINYYQTGVPKEEATISGTHHFSNGSFIKTYIGPEPRLSYRYNVGANASIKAGYNRMYQYLHLISNTTAITPLDIWLPSGYYFKPQNSDQVSVGYFKNSKSKNYELSGEVFYKKLNNIVDFKDGAQLIMNDHLETDLLQGKGRSYGFEFAASKFNGKKLTGTINYTFSRSFRTITGPTSIESINFGKEYPSSFDQPHSINLNWRITLPLKVYFTGSFTYRTGRPITTPLGGFSVEHVAVAVFSDRNQYRIPDYHRLDLALVFDGGFKRIQKWRSSLTFSVINVYGRRNPYSIFFQTVPGGLYQSYRLSIIGAAIPSITYSFKF